MTILVVDHGYATRCGIRDLGVRMADRLDAIHIDCNSLDEYVDACRSHLLGAVIVNYRPDLMPWWRPSMFPELAVLHNYSPDTVDARAADLIDRGFDRVLVLDPTVTPTRPDVHAVGRPLPPAPSSDSNHDSTIRIGSFGYAFPHKGFADVAAEVATIPDAVYSLHMPEAHFNGAGGALLYTHGIIDDVHDHLWGHRLVHTADELTPQQLVDRLAANTVNCLLYAPGQPDAGLSSALDYLIAAQRPMLLSNADMFAAAGRHAANWPSDRLVDVLGNIGHWERMAAALHDQTTGRFEADVRAIVDAL